MLSPATRRDRVGRCAPATSSGNPLSGEKALIVESGEETGGARLVADLAVEAGGFVPGGEHVHDHCTEHFEVRAGQIAFTLNGQKRALGPHDELAVAVLVND